MAGLQEGFALGAGNCLELRPENIHIPLWTRVFYN